MFMLTNWQAYNKMTEKSKGTYFDWLSPKKFWWRSLNNAHLRSSYFLDDQPIFTVRFAVCMKEDKTWLLIPQRTHQPVNIIYIELFKEISCLALLSSLCDDSSFTYHSAVMVTSQLWGTQANHVTIYLHKKNSFVFCNASSVLRSQYKSYLTMWTLKICWKTRLGAMNNSQA